MKKVRESNPKLLRTRPIVMAVILIAVIVAGLMSTTSYNLWVKLQAPVTDASVMWGSFATSTTGVERGCKPPVLSAAGAAVQGVYAAARDRKEGGL